MCPRLCTYHNTDNITIIVDVLHYKHNLPVVTRYLVFTFMCNKTKSMSLKCLHIFYLGVLSRWFKWANVLRPRHKKRN